MTEDLALYDSTLYSSRESNLVHFFAEKVLKGNQHVVINVYGAAGKGKSMFASGLIVGLANYMGERLHRDPRSLFNFNDNLACINLDRVQAIMENPKEYNLIWLDDIGVALNSRKFYKIGNMDFNDILQTFRPNKNILIVTTQYESLIDAVIRKLAHFHIEMTHKLFDIYNVPLTGLKCSEVVYKHRTGDIWYPFLQDKKYKYVQYISEKAPQIFVDEYDRIRAEEFKRMIQMKKDDKEKVKEEKKATHIELKKEIMRDMAAGVYGDMTIKAVCELPNSKLTYRQYRNAC